MNQQDLEWYAEGYRNGWLSPEETAWFEEGIQAGFIPQQQEEKTTVESVKDFGKSYVQGFGQSLTGALEKLELDDYERNTNVLSALQLIDQGIKPSDIEYSTTLSPEDVAFISAYTVNPEARDSIRSRYQEKTKNIYSGVGSNINNWFKETFPVAPKDNAEFKNQVASGLGQATGFILQSLATRRPALGTGLVSVQGAGQNAVAQFEKTLQETDDLEKAFQSADWGSAVGLTEALPIAALLARVDKQTGGVIKEAFKNMLIQGTEEGIQEAIQTILNNVIDKTIYDPDKNIFVGSGEGAAVGGTVGGIVGFLTSIVGGKRNRRIDEGVETTDEKTDVAKEPVKQESSRAKTALDFVADNTARKSVSVLDPFLDLPSAQELRNAFEHQEYGDAPGVVKPRDFFETKLNELGDLYNQVDNAINRLKDNFTGRFITPGVRRNLNNFIAKAPRLNKTLNSAVSAAKAGDFSQIDKLKGGNKRIAETAYAAYQVKQSVAEIETRLKQLGITPAYSKTRSGVPLFFNTKNIKKDSEKFDSWLQSEGYASNPVHAKEIREGILETGGVPFIQKPKLYRGYRPTKGKEKPGVVNKKFRADTVPQEFINTKIEQALPRFASKASTRIAHAKQFGARGEKIQQLVNKMIDEARAAGRTVPKSVVDRIYDLSDALVGNYNNIRSEGLSQANKAATVIQAASTLGGATLSSLGEPLVIIERAGLMPTLRSLPGALNQISRGIIRTFNKKFVNQSDMMRVAEEIGIAQEYANAEILTQTFSAEHSNLLDSYFKSPFGLFLYQWTRFVRSWATGAGMFKLNQYQREINSGKLSKLSRDQLADLGISVQDMTALNNILNQAQMTIRDVLIQNATQPNVVTENVLDTVLPSGLTGREILRGGLVRMVNESVMAPRATVRPMWLNDPHFALLGHLKSFPITFGNTVIKRMLRKLNPKRMGCTGGMAQAMSTLAVTTGLIGVAYVAQSLKHGLWGRDEDHPKYKPTMQEATTPKEMLSTRFGEAVQTAGLLGPWQMAVDAFRFKPETTLGPTISDINAGINEAIKWGNGDIETGDIMESLGQRTGQALGVLGKSKDIKEGVGEFFRDLVE